jgi:hypothetical protein
MGSSTSHNPIGLHGLSWGQFITRNRKHINTDLQTLKCTVNLLSIFLCHWSLLDSRLEHWRFPCFHSNIKPTSATHGSQWNAYQWLLNCWWPSPAQCLLVPSPTGLVTVLYWQHWEASEHLTDCVSSPSCSPCKDHVDNPPTALLLLHVYPLPQEHVYRAIT